MHIDLFSDTVCPWCRIGKRHLELALQDWPGEPPTIRYRSFFLDPTIPPEGHDFREHMTAKGGGRVPLEQFFAAPRERGAAVGLTFNFEAITRAPNTLLSHRLVALAPEEKRGELLDALYACLLYTSPVGKWPFIAPLIITEIRRLGDSRGQARMGEAGASI